MKKLKSKKNKIIFLSAIAFVAVFYFTVDRYQNRISTVFAEPDTYNETITCNGLAVRDEEIITTDEYKKNKRENIFFNCKSGDKIPKGSPIIKIYNNSNDVSEAYKREYIENKIESLGANTPYSYLAAAGVSVANKQVNKAIMNMLISNTSLNLKNKERSACDLWQALNKKACTVDSKDYLKEKIENLKGKQYSISIPGEKESILAPCCGKFVDHTDGFENKIPYNEVLNVHNIDGISEDIVDTENVLGKIIKKDTWYAVFNVSDEEARKIKGATELCFSISGKECAENIPCEIKLLRKENDLGKYTFIFSCDYMNDSLSKIRKENFKITTKSVPGIKIPQSSLRRRNNQEEYELGVFVDRAGYVKFKKINIVFSDSDFVIGEYNSDLCSDENYVQPGDKIITSGINLYEGKKIK